jgi:DNA-binding PadR family transcriptional regulator
MSTLECKLTVMSLRHAALGLLAGGPASGYDLLKQFEMSLANVWPATQSQLYTELGKMADLGLVQVAAEGPRGRKEYAITDEGMAVLRHWMLDVEPERVRRSDMLLRVFFLDVIEPAQAVDYLRGQARYAAQRYENLSVIKENTDDDDRLSVYGRIAVEWGLRYSAATREWAEWAAEQLKD